MLKNPGAQVQDLIPYHNQQRRLIAEARLDALPTSFFTEGKILEYLDTVSDDPSAMLFGWLEMERLGLVYFYLATHNREESEWRRTSTRYGKDTKKQPSKSSVSAKPGRSATLTLVPPS